MPAKRNLMAFRWRADGGTILVVLDPISLPHQLKKTTKKGRIKFPLWQNFLDPRMRMLDFIVWY